MYEWVGLYSVDLKVRLITKLTKKQVNDMQEVRRSRTSFSISCGVKALSKKIKKNLKNSQPQVHCQVPRAFKSHFYLFSCYHPPQILLFSLETPKVRLVQFSVFQFLPAARKPFSFCQSMVAINSQQRVYFAAKRLGILHFNSSIFIII